MHVALSPEQALLAETAHRLAASSPSWDALVPLVDGASAVEVALVAEALGAEVVAQPFLAQGVLAPALLAAAGEPTGDRRLAVLLTPDLGGFGGPGADGVALGIESATEVL
ncbi:MAG TPA: hypothetical protein VF228_05670, partial [Iamia sp.]